MRPTTELRRAGILLLVLVGACFLGWLAVGSFAERTAEARQKEEPKSEEKPEGAPDKIRPALVGIDSCSNSGCHGGNPPTKQWKKQGFEVLCRCDEADRYEKDDKHADAYKVLLGERGRRMAKLLAFDVTKSVKCLSCHAVVIKDAGAKDGSGYRYEREEEGVSCVACHGAAEDWVIRHGVLATLKSWRKLDRHQKERWFGMTDLWDPAKRAKVCASCHIGNADEGKVITHEMYAAGHPPLPGFEAATFGQEMPPHWEARSEKDKKLWAAQGYNGTTREQTQLLLVGAVVSLLESLNLIAAQAFESQKPDRDPELAMFDCYSCHHEIRSPSWRQTRPPVGKPGRVPMRTWPIDLVRLSVRHLAKDEAGAKSRMEELDAHTNKLQKAFTAKQLGDAKRIRDEADLFAKWADQLIRDLQKGDVPVDEAATKRLLGMLPAMFADKTHDYDSARQIAWGYEVLSRDRVTGKEKPAALVEMEKYLRLRLPVGRMKEGKSAIETELGDRMKLVNDYDAERFRDMLRKLGGR